jgi:hypothetical protein
MQSTVDSCSAAIFNFDKCAKLDGSVLFFLRHDEVVCRVDLDQKKYEIRVVSKCDKAIDFDFLNYSDKKLVVAVSKAGHLHLADEQGGPVSGSGQSQVNLESSESVITCCASDRSNLLAVAEWNSKTEKAWIKVLDLGAQTASNHQAKSVVMAVKSDSTLSRPG